jgi:hypothetical protein
MKQCFLCESSVPDACTGRIQDHCDWCGGPVPEMDLPTSASRWCSEECHKEQVADPDFGPQ